MNWGLAYKIVRSRVGLLLPISSKEEDEMQIVTTCSCVISWNVSQEPSLKRKY